MSNPIELNNIRVLSTTFEKLLITINSEQTEFLKEIDMPFKITESEEYGTSYSTVVKCASDKMCALYSSIPRSEITKACYDIVVIKNEWVWQGKSGFRLDAYFIKKLVYV